MSDIRVRICDPQHPHYPETGYLIDGRNIEVLGTPMAYLKLDSCAHGTDACYIKKGQVASLTQEPKPRRGKP